MNRLRRLARALGYELLPLRKAREPYRRLVNALEVQGIDLVLDGGANRGQYRDLLRAAGWRGPILSIEPVPSLHAELLARAAADPAWTIGPRVALGARSGRACLEIAAESDMSSLLPRTPLLERLSPSSRVVERIEVPRALDEQQGLKAEVLASRLVDSIAAASAAAVWRGERPAVAMGWKTGDFQVPALGLSMGTLVRMVEDLVGRPDRRVSGELVRTDGIETLRLRINPPRLAEEPITLSVVRGILETTQREMTLSLEKTARSSVFASSRTLPGHS